MINSADPDQLASSEANWSGSTLFEKAGYVLVHQDQGELSKLVKPNLSPHCILEESNFNFWYVWLCDLDIPREK